MNIRLWAYAMRLPFLTATVVPVVLGASIAWYDLGTCDWLLFLLTLAGIAFLNIGTNLANDYFDHLSGNDAANKTPTPFSGGSRVIQDGKIKPRSILAVSLGFFAAGSLLGLYLNQRTAGNIVLWLGIIGVVSGFFYAGFPLKLGYRGIGELLIGTCFGPLVVIGSYVVQTGRISKTAFAASLPVGLLIGLVVFINEFPDFEADRSVGKRTLVVLLGKSNALMVYHISLILLFLYSITVVAAGWLPAHILIVLLTLPLALKAYGVSKKHFRSVQDLLPANAATIGLHLSFGLLLSFGFILAGLFR